MSNKKQYIYEEFPNQVISNETKDTAGQQGTCSDMALRVIFREEEVGQSITMNYIIYV